MTDENSPTKISASRIQGYVKRIIYCRGEFIVKMWDYDTWKVNVINSYYVIKRIITSILIDVEKVNDKIVHPG